MLLPPPGFWTRQPTEQVQLRPDMRARRIAHALIPGLAGSANIYDYAQDERVSPVGAVAGDGVEVQQVGKVMQMHPGPGGGAGYGWASSIRTLQLRPDVIGPMDDLTVVWCGYIDNGGRWENGYGSLWALGTDEGGDYNNIGWGARAYLLEDNTLRSTYVYPNLGRVDADILLNPNPVNPIGGYLAAGFRQRGGSPTIDTFSLAGRQRATSTGGSGVRRASPLGMEIAGRADRGQQTGHNRVAAFLVFRDYIEDDLLWSLLANPYQVWMRPESAIWTPVAVSEALVLGSAPGVVLPTAAGGAASQIQRPGAAPASSAIAAAAGALLQVHGLAARAAPIAPAAAGGAAVQSQTFGAALAPVAITAPGAARVSSDALQAAIAVVGVTAGAAALRQVQVLGAAPAALALASAGGAARQVHGLGAAPAALVLAGVGRPLVQAQVLGAAPARVAVAAMPAAIPGPEVEVTYSAWRLFVVSAEQRGYSVAVERRAIDIAAEQRKFGVTDG
ncbi:MAG: hypothetical protein PGN26_14555 [Xylophilus ampelinus]